MIAQMPEDMFDRLLGLGVEEKVLVLTQLFWVGTLLAARPLREFPVIGAKCCLFSRERCTRDRRGQNQRQERILPPFHPTCLRCRAVWPLRWDAASERFGSGPHSVYNDVGSVKTHFSAHLPGSVFL